MKKPTVLLAIIAMINILVLLGSAANQFCLSHDNIVLATFLYAIVIIMPVNFLSSFELAFNRQRWLYPYLVLMPIIQAKVQSLQVESRGLMLYFGSALAGAALGIGLALVFKKSK